MEIPRRKKDPLIFSRDEHFRPGLTMEQLEKLPPAFVPKTGKVTAGNSSGINDGSAAMVIMSADKAEELGLKPLARIVASGRGACHPSVMSRHCSAHHSACNEKLMSFIVAGCWCQC